MQWSIKMMTIMGYDEDTAKESADCISVSYTKINKTNVFFSVGLQQNVWIMAN